MAQQKLSSELKSDSKVLSLNQKIGAVSQPKGLKN